MEAERMSPPMPVSYIHSTICDVELGDYNIPRDTSVSGCRLVLVQI